MILVCDVVGEKLPENFRESVKVFPFLQAKVRSFLVDAELIFPQNRGDHFCTRENVLYFDTVLVIQAHEDLCGCHWALELLFQFFDGLSKFLCVSAR